MTSSTSTTTSASAAKPEQIDLSKPDWLARSATHAERVDRWLRPHLERQSHQQKHPVYDFLFEYYTIRPAKLRRWHPGVGVQLLGASLGEEFPEKYYSATPQGVEISREFLRERLPFVDWVRSLLSATERRPPAFGCHGLHEWAMVYRAETVRHSQWPLRLSASEIAHLVESLPIRCSHYDAFRFFTDAARPLNRIQPSREQFLRLEQPGCLHTNMDLYKWAGKLSPLIPSELLADTFALAREIRETDMRASPYDFRELGFSPIPIETCEGRELYENHQREFFRRAQPLRQRLLAYCQGIRIFS